MVMTMTTQQPSWEVGAQRKTTAPTSVPVPIGWVRKQLGMTLKQMAELLLSYGCSVTVATLSRIENGKRGCTPELSAAIGAALSVYLLSQQGRHV